MLSTVTRWATAAGIWAIVADPPRVAHSPGLAHPGREVGTSGQAVWHARLIENRRSAPVQAPAQSASRPGADSVVRFRLTDQFGQVHDAADYRGRAFYIVGAGRKGRVVATAWATALGPLLAGSAGRPSTDVVALANLEGVPRLLRGLVRRRFPNDRRRAVLLDWDGAVTHQLAFDAACSTILAVGADGRSVMRLSTAVADSTSIAAFVRRAEAAMADAPPPRGDLP